MRLGEVIQFWWWLLWIAKKRGGNYGWDLGKLYNFDGGCYGLRRKVGVTTKDWGRRVSKG